MVHLKLYRRLYLYIVVIKLSLISLFDDWGLDTCHSYILLVAGSVSAGAEYYSHNHRSVDAIIGRCLQKRCAL